MDCETGALKSQPFFDLIDLRVSVPDPLLAFAVPVAVALFCSAPFFFSRLPASARFSSDPQQPQHALVHAVAALVVSLPPAEQPFYVQFHAFVQAFVVPLSHPTSLLALNGTYLASPTLTCSFFRSAASRALGLAAADVTELLRLLFEAEV